MQIGRRHWSIALIGAVLLHAAIAAAVLWQAPVVGASGVGRGGIEVSLGPTGGAPGSAPAAVEEAAAETEAVEPEAQTRPQPDEIAALEEHAEKATEVETQETAAREPLEVVTEAREAEPVETVEAQARPTPPLPQVRPTGLPKPAVEHQPEQQLEQVESSAPAERAQQQIAKLPASSAGAGGKAGIEDSSEAGSASESSGGGTPGEVADYMARLQAWLERHKEYPRHARQRRQEGTVLLYFVMNREGRVLDYRVTESSGYDLLDHAVEAMIQRAQPLPRMPEEMRQARLELIVPVQFFMQ